MPTSAWKRGTNRTVRNNWAQAEREMGHRNELRVSHLTHQSLQHINIHEVRREVAASLIFHMAASEMVRWETVQRNLPVLIFGVQCKNKLVTKMKKRSGHAWNASTVGHILMHSQCWPINRIFIVIVIWMLVIGSSQKTAWNTVKKKKLSIYMRYAFTLSAFDRSDGAITRPPPPSFVPPPVLEKTLDGHNQTGHQAHREFSQWVARQLGPMQCKISIFLNNPRPRLNNSNQVLCGQELCQPLPPSQSLLVRSSLTLPRPRPVKCEKWSGARWTNKKRKKRKGGAEKLREKRLKSWGWCSQMF